MKGRKPKVPEKSINEKVAFYKGETKSLKKEVENLRKRVSGLERRMDKIYLKSKKTKKDIKEDERIDILRNFHPDYREDD